MNPIPVPAHVDIVARERVLRLGAPCAVYSLARGARRRNGADCWKIEDVRGETLAGGFVLRKVYEKKGDGGA